MLRLELKNICACARMTCLRQMVAAAITRFAAGHRRMQLGRIVASWRFFTLSSKRTKAVMQRCIWRMKHMCVSRCFSAWAATCGEATGRRRVMQRIVRRLMHGRLTRYMRWWTLLILMHTCVAMREVGRVDLLYGMLHEHASAVLDVRPSRSTSTHSTCDSVVSRVMSAGPSTSGSYSPVARSFGSCRSGHSRQVTRVPPPSRSPAPPHRSWRQRGLSETDCEGSSSQR